MKPAVVFTISALLLYAILSGRIQGIWQALTSSSGSTSSTTTTTGGV